MTVRHTHAWTNSPVRCSGCGNDIIGPRFDCLTCLDKFTLCVYCEPAITAGTHPPGHLFTISLSNWLQSLAEGFTDARAVFGVALSSLLLVCAALLHVYWLVLQVIFRVGLFCVLLHIGSSFLPSPLPVVPLWLLQMIVAGSLGVWVGRSWAIVSQATARDYLVLLKLPASFKGFHPSLARNPCKIDRFDCHEMDEIGSSRTA
jgi:hypothetical protein